jgi:hypothetical protein
LVECFIVDEEGVNEVCGCDDIFANHVAHCGRFTVSARASSLWGTSVIVIAIGSV